MKSKYPIQACHHRKVVTRVSIAPKRWFDYGPSKGTAPYWLQSSLTKGWKTYPANKGVLASGIVGQYDVRTLLYFMTFRRKVKVDISPEAINLSSPDKKS